MVTEIIGRVSRGSQMDQVYLPKNRQGLAAGEYVLIVPLDREIKREKEGKQLKPCFYGIKNLEPIKLRIIEEIFKLIDKIMNPENLIITGSFLEQGFRFNDIDILIIYEKKGDIKDIKEIEEKIKDNLGLKSHVILIDNKTMLSGLSVDPLYSLMLSKSVSLKRFIYKAKRKINYKLLDLHLLKSKSLIDSFDILNGNEKYYLILNMISILLFVQSRKLSKEIVNKEMEKLFKIKIEDIKENLLDKKDFLGRYKRIYGKTIELIFKNIKIEKKNEQK